MTRGEIWWADFGIPFGSEPGFNRPVLIVQADAINKSKINTIIVIPFSTNLLLENAPGNIFVDKKGDLTLIDLGMHEKLNSAQRMNTISLIAG